MLSALNIAGSDGSRLEQILRKRHTPFLEAPGESGPDAGLDELALDAAFGIDARAPETKDLLHRDDLAFHARDLLQADQPPTAVGQALDLDDDVNRGSNLGAHGTHRE